MATAVVTIILFAATIVSGQYNEDAQLSSAGGANRSISTEDFLKISGMAKVNFLPPGQTEAQNNEDVNTTDDIIPRNNSEGRSLELSLPNFKGKNREGRIINDPTKFSVQGFIPIVSVTGHKKADSLDSYQEPLYPQQQEALPSIAGIYEPEKPFQKPSDIFGGGQFFDDDIIKQLHQIQQGSSSGGFVPRPQQINSPVYQEPVRQHISSIQYEPAQTIRRPTGKFIDNIEGTGLGHPGLEPENKCICVPFYMCRNGFLENYGRNHGGGGGGGIGGIGGGGGGIDGIGGGGVGGIGGGVDERSARGNIYNTYFSQENHTKAAEEVPNESTNNYKIINKNETAPGELSDYASDIMARFVGGTNNHGCGLLRRCCHLPPIISPVGSFPSIIPGGHQHLPIVHPDLHGKPFPPIHQKPFHPIGSQVHKPFPPAIFGPKPFPPSIVGPKPLPTIIGNQKPVSPISGFPLFPNPNIGLPKPIHPQPVYPGPQQDISIHHHKTCGIRNAFSVHARVKNLQYYDDSAEFGEYPWHAAILKKVGPADSLYVCGGTLIAPDWVATAAHCLKKHGPHDLKVRLGEWDVHRGDEFYPYVEKYIAEVVVHPGFYPGNLANDLALIKLSTPIDIKLPHIAPACVPDPHESFVGKKCWVTGWGKNAFGHQGQYQSVLKEVDVPVLNHHDCEQRLHQTRLGPYYRLFPGFVCAGGEPGKDACTGDGGSPLVCDVHGVWKVVGLVSWGIGCGLPGIPGVYVNMGYYRQWIESVVNRFG